MNFTNVANNFMNITTMILVFCTCAEVVKTIFAFLAYLAPPLPPPPSLPKGDRAMNSNHRDVSHRNSNNWPCNF